MPPLCDMSLVTVPVSLVCAVTNGMLWVCDAHVPGEKPSGCRRVRWLS